MRRTPLPAPLDPTVPERTPTSEATPGVSESSLHIFRSPLGVPFARTWSEVWGFGKWLTAQNVLAWFGAQGHSWVLAIILGAEQVGIYRATTHLVSISPVTSATIRELGYPVAGEAVEYTAKGVVDALVTLACQRHSRLVSQAR